MGVAGVNMEDNCHGINATRLFNIEEQCSRLAAARKAAHDLNIPIWINARTDTYLVKKYNDELTFEKNC